MEVGVGHVLKGRNVRLIARRIDEDDALFSLDEGQIAEVHLTWSATPEDNPQYPLTRFFRSFEEWHELRDNSVVVKQPVVCRSPDVMGGTPVFCGTRVPVQTLLDYLEAGETIGDFLEGFPSVTREQVVTFLEDAKNSLVESMA